MEIYRTLKPSGGVYLIISFHELDLILPLLRDLPGASWTVSHTTMERQVERLATPLYDVGSASRGSTIIANITNGDTNRSDNPAVDGDPGHEGSSTNGRKPLNVLIARRRCDLPTDSDPSSLSLVMEFESVAKHVQDVNDRWFREEQPLLTEERIRDLRRAFVDGGSDGSGDRSRVLSLTEAYQVIFTDAEREHLTFEHFLEDWEAFRCECGEGTPAESDPVGTNNDELGAIVFDRNGVTYDLALNFLEANQ